MWEMVQIHQLSCATASGPFWQEPLGSAVSKTGDLKPELAESSQPHHAAVLHFDPH